MMTGWQTGFLAEGQAEPPPGQLPSMEMAVVSEDYFATLQTPILHGRTFTSQDTNNSPPVIIIDQATAERFFPGKIRSANGFACRPTTKVAKCERSWGWCRG